MHNSRVLLDYHGDVLVGSTLWYRNWEDREKNSESAINALEKEVNLKDQTLEIHKTKATVLVLCHVGICCCRH